MTVTDPRPLDLPRTKKYVEMARRALTSVVEVTPSCNHRATEVMKMAAAYVSDADRFLSEGALADAFACANYAHGWLDAGVRVGLLRITANEELFATEHHPR